MQRVAVIGTGAMGGGVVQSLVRTGIATIARDIRPEAQARAVADGAEASATPADAAGRVDAVIVLVVDAEQVDRVLFGADGIVGAMPREGIVLVCSTVDPAYVAGLRQPLSTAGLRLLDAPVSGGPAKAAAGTMSMMIAGDAATRARMHPVLKAITGALFVIGDEPGDAAAAKIVNNLLAGANLAAAAEAMALAEAAGLDRELLARVIEASSGASWIMRDRFPRVLASDYAPRAATRVLMKDLGIALALAERCKVDTPLARAAHHAFVQAVEDGYAESDDASVFEAAKGAHARRR